MYQPTGCVIPETHYLNTHSREEIKSPEQFEKYLPHFTIALHNLRINVRNTFGSIHFSFLLHADYQA
jgi:hypothetical protein